jgi:hypothetical protein
MSWQLSQTVPTAVKVELSWGKAPCVYPDPAGTLFPEEPKWHLVQLIDEESWQFEQVRELFPWKLGLPFISHSCPSWCGGASWQLWQAEGWPV